MEIVVDSLTVTAKGQVTLKRDLLQHLGIRPGERVELEKLPGGELRVRAARPTGTIDDFLHILDGTGGDQTPSDLAKFVGLSPAATGRAVDAMTRAGLVSRRDDAEDRRVKRLTLTDDGVAAVAKITQARIAGLVLAVEDLDPDQRAALSDALAPLLASVPQTPGCSS